MTLIAYIFIRQSRVALSSARLRKDIRTLSDQPLKTVAAFRRQLDQLCVVTREALPETARVLDVRDAITRARARSNGGTHLEERDVARCADRFLRILTVADTRLTPEQIAQLEGHVYRALTVEAPLAEATTESVDGW